MSTDVIYMQKESVETPQSASPHTPFTESPTDNVCRSHLQKPSADTLQSTVSTHTIYRVTNRQCLQKSPTETVCRHSTECISGSTHRLKRPTSSRTMARDHLYKPLAKKTTRRRGDFTFCEDLAHGCLARVRSLNSVTPYC